ncbi:MAG TPA: metallophosphoesterase [Oscillospiraceae bacterium]|nr:metallophosphoesterase [Oscillospiraceae bacterium]HPF55066.1 metallophosphoesterase [Clostridiales bacterium]HPK34883.1 metallophosphoesterase [Oscillospiraceae bacterium]HPR76153.1 metallophosphoesterase [Oscillospiraceae bacterium]
MSVFAIADLHLSFTVDKPMNIFGGWSDYTERLETAWRKLVKDGDFVVLPGDISWAMDFAQAKADFAFLQGLPGIKFVMKGNHDYWWNTAKKMNEFLTENGFLSVKIIHNSAEIADNIAVCGTRGWFYDLADSADKKVLNREVGRLRMSIEAAKKTGKEPVVFLHYPPLYGEYRCDEIMDTLLEYGIKRCYYGHLHAQSHKKAVTGLQEGIEFRLISADYLKFVPELVR